MHNTIELIRAIIKFFNDADFHQKILIVIFQFIIVKCLFDIYDNFMKLKPKEKDTDTTGKIYVPSYKRKNKTYVKGYYRRKHK